MGKCGTVQALRDCIKPIASSYLRRVKRGNSGYNFIVVTKILHFTKTTKGTRTNFSKTSEKTWIFHIVHKSSQNGYDRECTVA